MIRKLTSIIFIVSIVILNLSPLFAYKVEAQWVVTDPALIGVTQVENTRKTIKDIIDSLAMVAARLAIQKVVNSTVTWAQSGFDGNPAYVTDPQSFLINTADQITGQYISDAHNSLSLLCSPFEAKIRIALRNNYIQEPQYQCSLSGIIGNIENYYNDFSQGGWDAWYAMSQTSGGNPYDAYVTAKIDLDRRVASAIGIKEKELEWNSGFLSYKKCDGKTITQADIDADEEMAVYRGWSVGSCIDQNGSPMNERTVTPGSIVKSQLDKVLPSGMESLITVNHVEQLIEAFATGLLKKYVFSSDGLFTKGGSIPTDTPRNSSSSGASGSSAVPITDYGSYNTSPFPPSISNPISGSSPPPPPVQTYSISGVVFNDNNDNAEYDAGDDPLSGERVTISNVGNTTTYAVVFTDSAGRYDYAGLTPGNYRVTHILWRDYIRTTDDSHIINIDKSNMTWDFGQIHDPLSTP